MLNRLFYRGPSLAQLHAQWAKQGKIDPNAPVTTQSSLEIDAPPEQVWARLVDLPSWPTISPAFRDVQLETAVAVDATFRFTLYNFPIRATFAVVNPPHQLVWTGVSLWFKAVDAHTLAALPDGRTRYTVAESFAGVLATLFTSGEQIRKQHRAWMDAFKAAVES